MSGTLFLSAYPAYATTGGLDELRAREYGYLDASGHVYLDYTGAGLPSCAQLAAHADRLREGCFGNPHSENPSSIAATALVDRARAAILSYFNAASDEYCVIFTPNATGACRLVAESYPFTAGARLVLTSDNHNSVNGIREYARARGATTGYIPPDSADLRVSTKAVRRALAAGEGGGRGLFAYPAQSNFTGVQHPLGWISLAQSYGYHVLLDAAAYAPANRLDLGAVHPDFVSISWYKVFGYPTGVGCLIARREALARLRRPWFSGGTIKAASALGGRHVPARDEGGFEDGTLNFHAIPDVTVGLAWVEGIGIDAIHERVACLTGWLLERLGDLRHRNGTPMVRVYGPVTGEGRGGTVALNLLDPDGEIIDERAIARDAAAWNISLRTGCLCNPGAGEGAFAIDGDLLALRISRPDLTIDDYLPMLGLPSGGAIRVSLGLVSNLADVELFIRFATETYRDRTPDYAGLLPRERC
ncbi:MAG TPA: aminotransferase class V-fold PLP-dependent enzyme [Streptosporangiaceae bacterium]|nr:aminotransferase class V-fold PLP-dependent enzyme [Streptosporangiaceae bacterium]